MGNFDEDFQQELKTQSWGLYAAGMFFIMFRLFARWKRLRGFRQYQLDDWLQLLVAGLYTALIVCMNTIAQGGGSNLYPPEMEGTFTPDEIEERIYGSKIVLVSEQAMLNVIYVVKVCVLVMYTRLTLGLNSQRFVRYMSYYVAAGWLATQIAMFTICRPFSGYWAMPPPDPQCTTFEYYAIVQACFNISSDLLMLAIPMPLIIKLKVHWRQKIVLVFIFSLGIFVIIAALLTKIFNLSDVWSTTYMLWYIREASVAVYVSNLPMIWPLLREWFPFLRHLNPAGIMPTTSERRTGTDKLGPTGNSASASRTMPSAAATGAYGTTSVMGGGGPSGTRHGSFESLDSSFAGDIALKEQRPVSKSGSTEHIVASSPPSVPAALHVDDDKPSRKHNNLGGIRVQQTIVVEEEDLTQRHARFDLEKGEGGVFDWRSNGSSQYRTDVRGRR